MFLIVALSALLVWFVVMLLQNLNSGNNVVALAGLCVSTLVILTIELVKRKRRRGKQ